MARLAKCDVCGAVEVTDKVWSLQVTAAGKTWKDRKNYDICAKHSELLTELNKLP